MKDLLERLATKTYVYLLKRQQFDSSETADTLRAAP